MQTDRSWPSRRQGRYRSRCKKFLRILRSSQNAYIIRLCIKHKDDKAALCTLLGPNSFIFHDGIHGEENL